MGVPERAGPRRSPHASGRSGRRWLAAATAAVVLAGATAVTALAQTSSPPDVEPTEVVDVDDFADRAQQWSEARRRAREEALRRAEELAAAARSTTTTAAPTTVPTRTTVPPTTTAATTTSAASTTDEEATSSPTVTEEPAGEGPAVKHPIPEGTTEAQWHALRQCESTQNYRAVSLSGRYRGAYQFSVRTWDWVAGMHYPELVGVDPIDAVPSDQDKMAYKLYEINGWDPWPTCKKRLPY